MSSVDATDWMLTARERRLWLGGDAPLEVGIRSRISPDLMQQPFGQGGAVRIPKMFAAARRQTTLVGVGLLWNYAGAFQARWSGRRRPPLRAFINTHAMRLIV